VNKTNSSKLSRRGKVQLVQSPVNVMVFRPAPLSPDQAQEIAIDINVNVEKRPVDFEDFKTLIETSDSPDLMLKSRIGN
jgi:hypothetical protein